MSSYDYFKTKSKPKEELEYITQKRVIAMLEEKGWFVKVTNGNMYQTGFPDLYATHVDYGGRWIEIKRKKQYKFQPSQLRDFPKLCANGTGVWILVDATEREYKKLFDKPNWWTYLIK